MSIGHTYLRNELTGGSVQIRGLDLTRGGLEIDVEGQAGAYALVYFNDDDTPSESNGSVRIYAGETWELTGYLAASYDGEEFLMTRPVRAARGHLGPDPSGPNPVISIHEFRDTT